MILLDQAPLLGNIGFDCHEVKASSVNGVSPLERGNLARV